jgi:hypothetical protein
MHNLLPENVILTDEAGKDLVLRRKPQVSQKRDPHLPCGGARVAFAQDDGLSNRSFVHPIRNGWLRSGPELGIICTQSRYSSWVVFRELSSIRGGAGDERPF